MMDAENGLSSIELESLLPIGDDDNSQDFDSLLRSFQAHHGSLAEVSIHEAFRTGDAPEVFQHCSGQQYGLTERFVIDTHSRNAAMPRLVEALNVRLDSIQ